MWINYLFSFQYDPWTILTTNNVGDVTKASGLVFAMLNEIGKTLNFSYVVVPPADNSFGVKKPGSNEFSGMTGQLIRQEVLLGRVK